MTKNTNYLTSLTKFYTLALLSQKPRHGYEIIKKIEQKTGKKPSAGQIYPILEQYKKENLIKTKKEKKEGREKKTYQITKKGQKKFSKLLKKFYNLIHEIIDPWMTTCKHCGCKVFKGHPEDTEQRQKIHKEKINKKEHTFCCKHCAKAYKKNK